MEMKTTQTITLKQSRDHSPVTIRFSDGYGSFKHYTKTCRWTEQASVELTVDIDALLLMMGKRAIYNSTGKSSTANGVIKAKVISRKEYDITEQDKPMPSDCEIVG